VLQSRPDILAHPVQIGNSNRYLTVRLRAF